MVASRARAWEPDAVLVVYTDGACSGNPGPGGWAWAVTAMSTVAAGAHGSGSASMTTNQRMEIHAALDALASLGPLVDGPIDVVSDSTYVVNCFRDRWWEGWIGRGWKNAAKKPVANRDLWEPLVALVRARMGTPAAVRFRWVKGHSGDPMNDLVDQLAVTAAQQQGPRQVVGLSDEPVETAETLGTHGIAEMLNNEDAVGTLEALEARAPVVVESLRLFD